MILLCVVQMLVIKIWHVLSVSLFAIQSDIFINAGLKYQGVSLETAMTIFKSAVNSTLAYGCHSIHLNRRHLKELDTIQSKLLKCILGLNKFSRGFFYKLCELFQFLLQFKQVRMLMRGIKRYCGPQNYY